MPFKIKNLPFWIPWLIVFTPGILGILGSLQDVPIHINAWDEETYLSYLGARNLTWIGGSGSYWFAGKIVSFLHEIGLDGSKINAICDLSVIVITVFIVVRYCKSNEKKGFIVPALTAILLYVVCLFNYANPILLNLDSFDIKSTITSGREPYSLFFRTPNPQFTILIIFTQYLLLDTKNNNKKLLGLLLTPIIIFFGYVFLLPGYIVVLLFLSKSWIANIRLRSFYYYFIVISLILVMSLILGFLAETFSFDQSNTAFIDGLLKEGRISETRRFRFSYISMAGVFLLLIFLCIPLYRKVHSIIPNDIQFPSNLTFGTLMASIISTSWPIVYGFDFEPKGFIDYGSGFWGSITFALLLLEIDRFYPSSFKVVIFFFAISACSIAFFVYSRMAVINFSYSQRGSRHSVETLSTNTLSVFAENNSWGSAVSSMSRAKQTPFLGSHQYVFKFYAKDVKDQIISTHLVGIICLKKMGLIEESEKLAKHTHNMIIWGQSENENQQLKKLGDINSILDCPCDEFIYIKRSKEKF